MEKRIEVLRVEQSSISKELAKFRACDDETRSLYCREWAQFIHKKHFVWNAKTQEEVPEDQLVKDPLQAGPYQINFIHTKSNHGNDEGEEEEEEEVIEPVFKKERSVLMAKKFEELIESWKTTPAGADEDSLLTQVLQACRLWTTLPSGYSGLPELFEPVEFNPYPDAIPLTDDPKDLAQLLDPLIIDRQSLCLPSDSFHLLKNLTGDILLSHSTPTCNHSRPKDKTPSDLDIDRIIFNEHEAVAVKNALSELTSALDQVWEPFNTFLDKLTEFESRRSKLMGKECQATIDAFFAKQEFASFVDIWALQLPAFKNKKSTPEELAKVDALFEDHLEHLKKLVGEFMDDFVPNHLKQTQTLTEDLWNTIVPTMHELVERMAAHRDSSNDEMSETLKTLRGDTLKKMYSTKDVEAAQARVMESLQARTADYLKDIDNLLKLYREGRASLSGRLEKLNNKDFKKKIKKTESGYYTIRQTFRYIASEQIFPEPLFCKFSMICLEPLMQEGEIMEAVTIEREVKRFIKSHKDLLMQRSTLLDDFERGVQTGRRELAGVLGKLYLKEGMRIQGENLALKKQNLLLKNLGLKNEESDESDEQSKKKKKSKKKKSASGASSPAPVLLEDVDLSTISPSLSSSEVPKTEEKKKPAKVEEKKVTKAEEKKQPKVEEKKVAKAEEKKQPKVEEKKTVKVEEKKQPKMEEKKSVKVEEKKQPKVAEKKPVKVEEKKQPKVEEKKPVKVEEKKQPKVEEKKPVKVEENKVAKTSVDPVEQKTAGTTTVLPSTAVPPNSEVQDWETIRASVMNAESKKKESEPVQDWDSIRAQVQKVEEKKEPTPKPIASGWSAVAAAAAAAAAPAPAPAPAPPTPAPPTPAPKPVEAAKAVTQNGWNDSPERSTPDLDQWPTPVTQSPSPAEDSWSTPAVTSPSSNGWSKVAAAALATSTAPKVSAAPKAPATTSSSSDGWSKFAATPDANPTSSDSWLKAAAPATAAAKTPAATSLTPEKSAADDSLGGWGSPSIDSSSNSSGWPSVDGWGSKSTDKKSWRSSAVEDKKTNQSNWRDRSVTDTNATATAATSDADTSLGGWGQPASALSESTDSWNSKKKKATQTSWDGSNKLPWNDEPATSVEPVKEAIKRPVPPPGMSFNSAPVQQERSHHVSMGPPGIIPSASTPLVQKSMPPGLASKEESPMTPSTTLTASSLMPTMPTMPSMPSMPSMSSMSSVSAPPQLQEPLPSNINEMNAEMLLLIIKNLHRENGTLVQSVYNMQQEMSMMTSRYAEIIALAREREAQTLALFESRKQTEMEEARRYVLTLESRVKQMEEQLKGSPSTPGFGNQDLFANYREEMTPRLDSYQQPEGQQRHGGHHHNTQHHHYGNRGNTKKPWGKNTVIRCGNCGEVGHASQECKGYCRYCGSMEHLSEACPMN